MADKAVVENNRQIATSNARGVMLVSPLFWISLFDFKSQAYKAI